MAAASLNFTIEQGATWERDFTLTRNDAPWNVSKYKIRMQLRKEYTSTSTELELTEENDRVSKGPSTNQFKLLITPADTALLTFETVRYDLELEDTEGVVTRLLDGLVYLNKEITRDE